MRGCQASKSLNGMHYVLYIEGADRRGVTGHVTGPAGRGRPDVTMDNPIFNVAACAV